MTLTAPAVCACHTLLVAVGIALACGAAAESHSGIELDCVTAGYDILITNDTEETIEEGRSVNWEVRFVRKSGAFDIETPLEPGQDILVSGALGSDYLSAPQPCTAIAR